MSSAQTPPEQVPAASHRLLRWGQRHPIAWWLLGVGTSLAVSVAAIFTTTEYPRGFITSHWRDLWHVADSCNPALNNHGFESYDDLFIYRESAPEIKSFKFSRSDSSPGRVDLTITTSYPREPAMMAIVAEGLYGTVDASDMALPATWNASSYRSPSEGECASWFFYRMYDGDYTTSSTKFVLEGLWIGYTYCVAVAAPDDWETLRSEPSAFSSRKCERVEWQDDWGWVQTP